MVMNFCDKTPGVKSEKVNNFCDKTLTDVNSEKVKVCETLQRSLKPDDFEEIIETIQDNEKSTTQTLKRRKAKTFNHLLYKSKTRTQVTPQRFPRKQNGLFYANITKKRSQPNIIDKSLQRGNTRDNSDYIKCDRNKRTMSNTGRGQRGNTRDNSDYTRCDRNKRTMSNTDITDHASSVKTPAQNEIRALHEEIQHLKQQNKTIS